MPCNLAKLSQCATLCTEGTMGVRAAGLGGAAGRLKMASSSMAISTAEGPAGFLLSAPRTLRRAAVGPDAVEWFCSTLGAASAAGLSREVRGASPGFCMHAS